MPSQMNPKIVPRGLRRFESSDSTAL